MAPAKRPVTRADLEALPEHLIGEILGGELVVSPRPRPHHARAIGKIIADLDGPFDRGRGGPGGWWFLPEPELHLGHDVVVPDVAGWRRERLPQIPDAVGIEIAPDWVCEVLSPSTAKVDRIKKLPIYAGHRVGHAWLADPVLRTLEVYRLDGAGWVLAGLYSDDARARIAPFEAIELDLSAWWMPRPAGTAAEPPLVWSAAPAT